MTSKRFQNLLFGTCLRATAIMAIVLTLLVASHTAQAQTYKVLYNFSGGQDGGYPYAGLTMDSGGNLYGTTILGGSTYNGVVFKLARKGSGWILNPLYSFSGTPDGGAPIARVIFGPDGSLYGTTTEGGIAGCSGFGCGTVFNVRPPATACKTALCPWTETVLYKFTGGTDGRAPEYGDVVFDQFGNMYGTTQMGGAYGAGEVWMLSHSFGVWTQSVLYSFTTDGDGANPLSGLIFDKAGNLYGTTHSGRYGVVYKLTPSGSEWVFSILYRFQNGSDGEYPYGGVVPDQSGNLFGACALGGVGGGGTVYEFNGTLNVLYSFSGSGSLGPVGTLTMDTAGNLYGTTEYGGAYGYGAVFKLAPTSGGWTYTGLHDFAGGSDGKTPIGSVILDAKGNLYGATSAGGASGTGVVWEITL